MVKPNASITMKVPISEIGMAMIGIITERGEPRKMKTTAATISSASSSAEMTSFSELCTKSVAS